MANNTPTLDEAMEMASSTLKNDEVEIEESKEETHQQETEEETPKEETPAQPDGEEEKEVKTEEEESFVEKKLSYDELPDDLKPIYKDWQKQYTQKRQAEKAYIAELEKKLEQSSKPEASQEKPKTDEGILTKEELDKYLSQRDEEKYLQTQEKEFLALDDRLVEDNPDYDPYLFGGIIERVIKERDEYDKKHNTFVGFDFVGRAKKLIKEYDQKLQTKTNEAIKEKTAKAKQILEKSTRENPKAKSLNGKTFKRMDLDDATDAAFDKLAS